MKAQNYVNAAFSRLHKSINSIRTGLYFTHLCNISAGFELQIV